MADQYQINSTIHNINNSNDFTIPPVIDDDDVNSIKSLSELGFTDIYISMDGEAFMRGLETKFKNRTPPLTGIPYGVNEEVNALQKRIFKKGENSDSFFDEYNGVRYRVTKMPTKKKTWFTLRRSLWPIPRFVTLKGIPKIVAKTFGRLGRPSDGKGLILFCGETGSGKTTTAYSLLMEYLLGYGDIATTIEDPVEILIEGPCGDNSQGYCFQHEVENNDFEAAIKLALRETPRYIFFGEIRGHKEAAEALRASLNGHIVISTIHAGNVQQCVDRIISLANDGNIDMARQSLAMGIKAIVHQRLSYDKDSSGKVLDLQTLFVHEKDTRVRNLIASGDTRQLASDIERQKLRIERGESPLDYDLNKITR